VNGDAVLEIADICASLRDRIRVIVDDLPVLKSQADSSDSLALHIIDRVLVATDNATGCAVLAEQNLAAPLASAERSIFESLLAVYWSSQKEEYATILLSVMRREMMRLMRLNLKRGHAVIRHKDTGAIHTEEILDDQKMSDAGRPPSFRTMAEQAGLGKLYDTSYGFMSMLAHGTATEMLANPDQRDLISAQLHSVSAFLRCIYLIAVNRIRKKRATSIAELESILKIALA
jgi:hypothetical protein